jgi:hypothetical protein
LGEENDMGWSIGWDSQHSRDIGYGVPAICDHPDCNAKIDRGLAYVCGGEPYGGNHGCGLYFCEKHLLYVGIRDEKGDWHSDGPQRCERCVDGKSEFNPKPDDPMWTKFKLADESWAEWRKNNGHPEPTSEMIEEIRVYEESL